MNGAYTVALTWLIAKVIGLVLPMRADIEAETNGLDLSVHGERAYDLVS